MGKIFYLRHNFHERAIMVFQWVSANISGFNIGAPIEYAYSILHVSDHLPPYVAMAYGFLFDEPMSCEYRAKQFVDISVFSFRAFAGESQCGNPIDKVLVWIRSKSQPRGGRLSQKA